jgi:hypothetical protein
MEEVRRGQHDAPPPVRRIQAPLLGRRGRG